MTGLLAFCWCNWLKKQIRANTRATRAILSQRPSPCTFSTVSTDFLLLATSLFCYYFFFIFVYLFIYLLMRITVLKKFKKSEHKKQTHFPNFIECDKVLCIAELLIEFVLSFIKYNFFFFNSTVSRLTVFSSTRIMSINSVLLFLM